MTTVRELIAMLANLPADGEVIFGSSETAYPNQFAWRRDPRVVEPPKKLRVEVPNAIFIEGLGDVVANKKTDKKTQQQDEGGPPLDPEVFRVADDGDVVRVARVGDRVPPLVAPRAGGWR